MIGLQVQISNKIGSKITIDRGTHSGIMVDLIPNRKIVEAYRHNEWEKGHYSILSIDFIEDKDNTLIILNQIGMPDDFSLEKGWKEFYFPKIKNYFAKKINHV